MLSGRQRWMHKVNSDRKADRDDAERAAANSIMQVCGRGSEEVCQ